MRLHGKSIAFANGYDNLRGKDTFRGLLRHSVIQKLNSSKK